MRKLKLVSSLLLWFVLTITVHAQYSVSYSGGSVAVTGGGGSGNYSLNNGRWGGGGSGQSVNCSGTITATYTWQGSGPPPPKAVVIETCQAQSWAYFGTAAAANGLGDAPVTTSTTNPPWVKKDSGMSGSNYILHYAIKDNPGTSFTWPCTPSASGGSTASYAHVSYAASAYPLGVYLYNTIKINGTDRLLIGQKLEARVEQIAPIDDPANTFSWSISGGNPFRNYLPSSSSAVLVPWNASTSDLEWCRFATPSDSVDITCVVYLAKVGQSVTLTENLKVDKPFNTITAGIGVSDVSNTQGFPRVSDHSINGWWFSIWGGDAPRNYGPPATFFDGYGFNSRPGFVIGASVETPPAYLSQGYGTWNFTQTVVPSRTRIRSGVTEPLSLNGVMCLDTYFPYAGDFSALPSATPEYDTRDTPGDQIGTLGSTFISDMDIADSFKMYVLYDAPGDAVYVPLKYAQWYWGGDVSWNAGTSTWTVSPAQGWSYGPDFPSHPVWSSNVANATY